MTLPYIRFACRQASGFTEQAADQTRDDLYASGQEPCVGDIVECLPDEGSYVPGLPGDGIREGEQYEVLEIDGGYLYFADNYGWWPTRFILITRKVGA